MLTVLSDAFQQGQTIPLRHTGDGENVSPFLTWRDVPPETKAFVLICDDPDAPGPEPFVHWLVYDLPAGVHRLEEGSSDGGSDGLNSWHHSGYGGPCPPEGDRPHHYRFRLYALSEPLGLQPGANRRQVLEAMRGRILAEGELTGVYGR